MKIYAALFFCPSIFHIISNSSNCNNQTFLDFSLEPLDQEMIRWEFFNSVLNSRVMVPLS